MALTGCTRNFFSTFSASSSPSSLQFRLPLVRTLCVLSVGLNNLNPVSAYKTGCSQSLPLVPLLRCKKKMIAGKTILSRRCEIRSLFLSLCIIGLTHLIMSKFFSQSTAKGVHPTTMEGNTSTTVPSIVVYVTVPNKEAGKKLAESIIKEKLAACVNRVPGIESVYFWDGQVQTDSEELLIIKTRESLLKPLTEHVKANHEYDLPEVIAMPIIGGNEKYLEWIKNSTMD
ncbi:protein CutA, chloroplastic isoform X1 [Aristolochia californica]|uniref:protein CutA, chloroplastic isoform X1 n=1 Tax=Aristolochia californica TaxID=171875 RepID=UPI0035E17D28